MKPGRRTVVALVLALLAGCSRQPQEPREIPPSPFQRFVQGLGVEPACAREIPVHWSPSLPVPVLVDHRLHYRVFFSGWGGRPDTGIVIHDAEGDALFSADGKVLECRQRAETGRTIPEQKLPDLSLDEFDVRVHTLYGAIEKMGRLYASGIPVIDADRAQVQSFSREFAVLTGRGHAASYRALSPDFWTWVEKNSGPNDILKKGYSR